MMLKEIKGSGHAELGGMSVSVRGVAQLCGYLNGLGDVAVANYFDITSLPTWGAAPSNTVGIWSWEWVSGNAVKVLTSAPSGGFGVETVYRGDGSYLGELFFKPAVLPHDRSSLVYGDDYGSRPGEGGIGDYQPGDEPQRWEE